MKKREPYTGPSWLGPMFLVMAAFAVFFQFLLPFMDTEVEFECNE